MERFAAGASAPVFAALDALATRMGLGMLVIDSTGNTGNPVFSNRTALELLGSKDAAALPERWAALQSAKTDVPGSHASGVKAFTADLPVGAATHYLRGEIVSSASGLEVFLKDRRSLGELDIELLCASRMREWIHQCDALAHDANGALNTIQLTLELLDGQWPGEKADAQAREPHRRNHVGVIRDNLEKLKTTMHEFVASHESSQAAPAFDLRDVVKEAAVTLRMPARRRRLDLQVATGDVPLPVRGNRARIRQALVNVALSRIESLAERSRLTIGANALPQGAQIVCLDAEALADSARTGIFRILHAESGAGSGADALRLARAMVECEAGEFILGDADTPGTAFRFLFSAAAA